jgi:iron complex transport system substrate-binding protein
MRAAGGRAPRARVAALLAIALAFSGARAAGAPIAVAAAWAPPTPAGATVAAGYFVATNRGGDADRLTGASSPRAARVEMHESRIDGGMARMRPVASLPLAPGASVRFEPGGLHLMLVGLAAPLVAGERVPLTLRFERAGPVEVVLEVRDGAPAAAPAVPQRIVTLAPHLTELVYAAGAGERLVGTLDTSDYPPAARLVPRVGDVDRLDAERLVALRPDLVLLWGDGSPTAQRELLRRLGLPVLSLEQHTLADVPASLERLGAVLGTEPVARAAADALRRQIAALRSRYQGERRLRVFYQVWSMPLFTLGGRHVLSEMLRVCGAENVFADQPVSSFAVDEEAVYARDPDVVALAGTPAEDSEWLNRWRSRAPLRAVASGNVITLDPDLVNRMGPRIGLGTATLCARLAERRAATPAR